jgi:hypothetical protein
MIPLVWSEIPYSFEQGIFFCGTGNLPQANRESLTALGRRACAPRAPNAARSLGQNIPGDPRFDLAQLPRL